MATIKDIADKLGVSISTVSKGLNSASDISEETRQTVLNAAVELGYVRKKKKSAEAIRFCVITEDLDQQNINQSNYELISGFRSKATEDTYQIDVISLGKLSSSRLTYDLFAAHNSYSGVLMLTSQLPSQLMAQLSETRVPTVLYNHTIYNPFVANVGTDFYEGLYQAVEFAVSKGHSHIAFINGSPQRCPGYSMEQAFIFAMESFPATLDHRLIFTLSSEPDSMRNAVQTLFNRKATLVICSNDIIASSVITEAYRQGKKVPEDLSVIGFDDLPIARYLSPPLTTVRQDRLALGKCAYYALKSLIRQIPVGSIIMHSKLIVRESVIQMPPRPQLY